MGLTHQDFKPENIIEDGMGSLHVIDFDNLYYGVLLYDIMTAVIWLCFENNYLRKDLFVNLLEGYESERCLCQREIEHIDDALRFRLLREIFDWPRQYMNAHAVEQCQYFMGLYRRLDTEEINIREYWHNPGGWNGDASRL
jgi:Ser/Thr protein kinase RdoA (MazF antagonist)